MLTVAIQDTERGKVSVMIGDVLGLQLQPFKANWASPSAPCPKPTDPSLLNSNS